MNASISLEYAKNVINNLQNLMDINAIIVISQQKFWLMGKNTKENWKITKCMVKAYYIIKTGIKYMKGNSKMTKFQDMALITIKMEVSMLENLNMDIEMVKESISSKTKIHMKVIGGKDNNMVMEHTNLRMEKKIRDNINLAVKMVKG